LQTGVVPVQAVVFVDVHAPHVWLASSQRGPLAFPVQSPSVTHSTHAPEVGPLSTQAGTTAVRQGSAVVAPKSPVHATHASFGAPTLQTGVVPVQAVVSVAVHVPQVWLVVSQSGPLGLPVQPAFAVQPLVAAQTPVGPQIPDWHTTAPFEAVQGPSPLA
jgi:hypothetical protein